MKTNIPHKWRSNHYWHARRPHDLQDYIINCVNIWINNVISRFCCCCFCLVWWEGLRARWLVQQFLLFHASVLDSNNIKKEKEKRNACVVLRLMSRPLDSWIFPIIMEMRRCGGKVVENACMNFNGNSVGRGAARMLLNTNDAIGEI